MTFRFSCIAPILLLLAGSANVAAGGNPVYPGTLPTKGADLATVAPGGTILWTITIYNDAFDDPASVYLSDDVPDPADGLPVQPFDLVNDVVSVPGGSRSYNGDRLSLSSIPIGARSSGTVVLRTRVLASAPDGTIICNRAYTRHVISTCMGNPFPICDDFPFDSSSTPVGSTTPGPVCVTVRVPPPIDVVAQPAATTSADSCPSDPQFPAPDGVITPGETLNLTLAIRNLGGSNAPAQPAPITGTITPGAGFSILTGSRPYTTTPANVLQANGANQGTNAQPFVIRVDPAIACPGTLSLTLVVSNIQGGPYQVTYSFPVGLPGGGGCIPHCLNLALSPGAAAVRDLCAATPPGGDGRIDPGEDVYLTLPVANAGPDRLGGNPTITGTLTSQTAGVSLIAGSVTSTYPDLAAGSSGANLTEFGIRLSDTLACGTPISLRLVLTTTDGGPRTIDYNLAVAAPCTVCNNSCVSDPEAIANGPIRYCQGGTVELDGSGSVLTGCSGTTLFQWFQGTAAILGATAPTYDVPDTLPPGNYIYSVEATCSSQALCSARSAPVLVTVDATPTVVVLLKGTKDAANAEFGWTVAPTAVGGYRLYRTQQKNLIPVARNGTVGVVLAAQTAADPNANQATDVGAVTAAPPLYHYQVLAVCSDNRTEGPN